MIRLQSPEKSKHETGKQHRQEMKAQMKSIINICSLFNASPSEGPILLEFSCSFFHSCSTHSLVFPLVP